jgi:7-dehydrocholesterol reductase
MRHDRLGWYLGWGSHAWLPLTYCLQAWYLSMRSKEQVALTTIEAVGIVCTFLLGMTLFRLANNQKDEFRAAPTQNIWGRKPEYIEVKYSTGDNQQHTSLLLCSGYWGFSRHFNYLSDLIICLSFSLPCRGESILPYFYIVYMFMLLLHRSIRDDRKCRAKYGEHWDEYCRRVPYVLVPGLY